MIFLADFKEKGIIKIAHFFSNVVSSKINFITENVKIKKCFNI